ncbi:hypothetical protein Bealeia1_00055 [Candidatus Bealeia paramacronuclearis]|uniref:Rod shape-determining protein MreD n=1 Tax=Candidatus Bealeia paramacronuclearis TaxID=1921001 RepID=A0ABZ2C0A2_9PROT|nr:hypothetical protein [Candidatus Bealeia paramacronuclearis]
MNTSFLQDGKLLVPLKAVPLLFLLILNIMTIDFSPPFLSLFPALGFAFLFHWLIYRPNILPPLGLMAIAILNELTLKDHFSVILPALYLLSFTFILKYRHRLYGQRFYKIWVTYCAYSFACLMLYGMAKVVFAGEFYPPSNLLVSWILVVLLYPLLTLLLAPLQRLIPFQ